MSSSRDPRRIAARRVVVALRPLDGYLLDALRGAGATVVPAAAETFDETVVGERGAAVVVDADLPGALAAIHRLRHLTGPVGQVPIVVLGSSHDRSPAGSPGHPATQAGADVVLQRPVSPHELSVQLEALLEAPVSATRSSRVTGRISVSPRSASLPPRERLVTPGTSPALPRTEGPASGSALPAHETLGAPTSAKISLPPSAFDRAALPSLLPPEARPSLRVEADEGVPAMVPDVASALRRSLQEAFAAEGVAGGAFDLPPLADDSLDDLVPPELLEPLDGPLEPLDDEGPVEVTHAAWERSAGHGVTGLMASRRTQAARAMGPGTAPMPLTLDGDLRLAGTLGRYGVAQLFAAAWRARATGVLVLGQGDTEWSLAIHAGHLLAVRGSRPDDAIGPTLARLGYIPREAARFAQVPLDAGLRGAALLAARGYVPADGLAPILARAAQEMVFDLLCLDTVEWELRTLEHSVGVPLPTRALDALLVLGVRARLEPAQAYLALGGDDTTVSLRPDPAALAPLPLTASERAAAATAQGTSLATILRDHGEEVLPALLALSWLQLLRLEGPAHDLAASLAPPGPERTRMRALIEAAEGRDLLALLGVSAWATRRAAQFALDARRAEVDVLRARHAHAEALQPVYAALDEAAALLGDVGAWERFTNALRTSVRDEG